MCRAAADAEREIDWSTWRLSAAYLLHALPVKACLLSYCFLKCVFKVLKVTWLQLLAVGKRDRRAPRAAHTIRKHRAAVCPCVCILWGHLSAYA